MQDPACVQVKAFKDIVRRLVHSKEAGLDIIPSPDDLKRMVEQQPRLLEHLAKLGVTTADWDKVCAAVMLWGRCIVLH